MQTSLSYQELCTKYKKEGISKEELRAYLQTMYTELSKYENTLNEDSITPKDIRYLQLKINQKMEWKIFYALRCILDKKMQDINTKLSLSKDTEVDPEGDLRRGLRKRKRISQQRMSIQTEYNRDIVLIASQFTLAKTQIEDQYHVLTEIQSSVNKTEE
jgi:hypothetical protein